MSPLDAGAELVERVRRAYEPDPRWIDRLDAREFIWWPHRLKQRVWAEPPRAHGGRTLHRVHAEIELLAGVRGTGATFAALSEWQARNPSLSALRWDAERGVVSLRASTLASDDDLERPASMLAHAALLQLGQSLQALAALEGALDGAAALAPRADGPRRDEPDPLAAAAAVYAERGRGPSPFGREALDALASSAAPPWQRARVDGGTLNAEIPVGPAASGRAPAILRLTGAQQHPDLGAGLLAVLALPPESEPVAERFAATAALLNEAESREWTGCDQFGGWCVHASLGLVFVSFVPALCDRADLLESFAWTLARRARWAVQFLGRVEAQRPPVPG